MNCSICDKEIPVKEGGWSQGNNAQPINDGRCCDECNVNVVIPARLHAVSNRHEEQDDREYWLYLLNHGGYYRVVGEFDKWTVAHEMTGETGRLFATAPELLAACKKVIAAFGEKTFRPDLQADAINAVAAALAKIEGETDA